jgi:exosortase A
MSVSGSATPTLVADSRVYTRPAAMTSWKGPLLALLTGWVVTLFAFRQTVASLTKIWSGSSTYSYGFVILPICAALVWRRREELKNLCPTTSVLGLALFLLSTVLWVAGNVADVQLIQHIALVAMLDSLVWALLGNAVVRTLRFPLFFLFLGVPVGDSLVPILQQWTATLTVSALRLSGIPAFQDGLILSTPSGNWQVAEACSGIRYLIASIVMGILLAGVAYRSWKRRITILALSAVLPIVANAIRAYGIVVLAYLSGNSVATGVDHLIYGFVFFSLLSVVLIIVAVRWYEPDSPSQTLPKDSFGSSPGSGSLTANLLAIIAVVISATILTGFLWSRTPAVPPATSFAAPAGWIPATELDNEWAPEPASIRGRTIQTFSSGLQRVSTCTGWYFAGQRGIELIDSFNLVGNSGVWTLLGSDTRRATIEGVPMLIAEHTIGRGRERRLVWVWYSIGGQRTSDPYELRAIEARNRLFGRPQNTALYAVSAPYQSDPSEASAVLASFLK